MCKAGYGESTLYLVDQDSNYHTVRRIFDDIDGNACLYSSGNYDHSVEDILDELDSYDVNNEVYFNAAYIENVLYCKIERGWDTDKDDDVLMDIIYINEDYKDEKGKEEKVS